MTPRSLAENIVKDIYTKAKNKKKGIKVVPGKSKSTAYQPSKENTKRVMDLYDQQKNL